MHLHELPTKQDLAELETRLIKRIESLLSKSPIRNKQWLRSKEVRELLNISPGTLKNLRVSGALPYTRIGATLYYDYQEVQQILEQNRMGGKWNP